jgi:hypothetical protein
MALLTALRSYSQMADINETGIESRKLIRSVQIINHFNG